MSFNDKSVTQTSQVSTPTKTESSSPLASGVRMKRSLSSGDLDKTSVTKTPPPPVRSKSMTDVHSDIQVSFQSTPTLTTSSKSLMSMIKSKFSIVRQENPVQIQVNNSRIENGAQPSSVIISDKAIKEASKLIGGKPSSKELSIFSEAVKDIGLNRGGINQEKLLNKINNFNSLVTQRSGLMNNTTQFREAAMKFIMNADKLGLNEQDAMKFIQDASFLIRDGSDLKDVLSGNSMDEIKGKLKFTIKQQLSSGLLEPKHLDTILNNTLTADDKFQVTLEAASKVVDIGNKERAEVLFKFLDTKISVPEQGRQIDFLKLKLDVNSVKNELVGELAVNSKDDFHINNIKFNLARLVGTETKPGLIDTINKQIESTSDPTLKQQLKSLKTEIRMTEFKADLLLNKEGKMGFKNIQNRFNASLKEDIKDLKSLFGELEKEGNDISKTLTQDLKVNRSSWESFKGKLSDLRHNRLFSIGGPSKSDISGAFREVSVIDNQLKQKYQEYAKVSGSSGEIRSKFKQFFSKVTNVEKADNLFNEIKDLEAKRTDCLNTLARASKSAPKESRAKLERFIEIKSQQHNITNNLQSLENLSKKDIDDIGSLTRQIATRENLAKKEVLMDSKTYESSFIEFQDKLSTLKDSQSGQEVVFKFKGFIGASTDIPCGGNLIGQVDAKIAVNGELRATRMEDGKIRVIQNLREGVEGKIGTLGGFFAAQGRLGAIQHKEFIFDDLDSAIKTLSNTKGMIPSSFTSNRINSMETGSTLTYAGATKESITFDFTDKNNTQKTKWIKSISATYYSLGASSGNMGLQAGVGAGSLLATSQVNNTDFFASLGINTQFGNKIDIRMETEAPKRHKLANLFKLTDGTSKVDLSFSFKEVLEIKKLSPENQKKYIEFKANELANMIERNINWTDYGENQTDLLVTDKSKDLMVQSIANSLTQVVNDDNILAKINRSTKDTALSVTGNIGNVLTGDKNENASIKDGLGQYIGKNISSSFENASKGAKEVLDVGVGIGFSSNSSDGFCISIPISENIDHELRVGTPKVGIRTKTETTKELSLSKIIPFVKFRAGKETDDSKIEVVSQVTEKSSTAKYQTTAVGNFEKYITSNLGLVDKIAPPDLSEDT